MSKGARLIACGVAALATSAAAKDYGQLGTMFPIEEVDLLKAISARLHGMQANGDLTRAQQAQGPHHRGRHAAASSRWSDAGQRGAQFHI